MNYTYGPVPSRRLGFSLGVDILPYKTCTIDCLFCQLGRTSNLTIERGSFFPKEDVLSEILTLARRENPDYITFSGSGEPALNSDIGWLIREIKKEVPQKVVVLTNSTLLWMPEVREDLKAADIVVPSLDAGTDEYWQKVNRPHPDLEFDRMIEGLIAFSREFSGEIWVEILLVKGVNDTQENTDAVLSILSRMRYTKIQLNTVVRPPSEKSAVALSQEEMEIIAERFPPNTEIVSTFQKRGKHVSAHGDCERILAALARRPMTINDIEQSLGIPAERAEEVLKKLTAEDKARKTIHGQDVFFESLK
ncbi:radical SAM protein [candidate division WOR-3 bacterium]|nr:radical SAM protein [candidate division WOR-3 bacterium]